MQSSTSETAGPPPTDEEAVQSIYNMFHVVSRARLQPFTTKSDFARMAATEIAVCAINGWISTQVSPEMYGNVWMVTADGLNWLEEVDDVFGFRH